MSAGGPKWPTLSQLRKSDFSYFDELASYLGKISPKAQKALEGLAEDVKRPGGVEWEGASGDTAAAQAEADLIMARPVMWSWDDVAAAAARWKEELQAGTRTALDAVDDAERGGFDVSDSYGVADTREAQTEAEYEQRLQEAEAHAAYIRHQVGILVANESRINGELQAMTAGWGTLSFPEAGPGATNDPAAPGYTVSPFTPSGIEEGGTPGFDAAHNAQGIRGDEGVIISGNRILFGDTAQLASGKDGDLPYIGTPMYEYSLDKNGMPILGKRLGTPTTPADGTRLIPTGSTGADGMPNGTNLLFGKDWKFSSGGVDPAFPHDTLVFDTNGTGPFPQVAKIPGITDVTAVPDPKTGGLIVSGMQGDTRNVWLTPPQSTPGNYDFLKPESWTPLGGVASHSAGEPTASMFRVDSPSGPMFGMISPGPDNGMELRIAPNAAGLASAPTVPIYNGPGLYSPNVTQITPLPNGSYDVAMTFSQRIVPDGVPPSQLGRQTYENIFGHITIAPK